MTNKELDDKLRAMGKDPNDPLGYNKSTGGKVIYWLTEGIWVAFIMVFMVFIAAAKIYSLFT